MTDIIRINRTKSFKVMKRCKAIEIAAKYDIDSTYRNAYYIQEIDLNSEPRPIRDNVFYLKSDLADKIIYVLALQTSETKLVKKRKKQVDESSRKLEETDSE